MSTSNERDKSVERLLRQSLKTPQRAARTEACLDPETLAAWLDHGLVGAALDKAESHVVGCARCQSLVGALVRATAGDPPYDDRERASRPWWLTWMVPLAAAAAAVALYVAVPRNPSAPASPLAEDRPPAEVKKEVPAALQAGAQAPGASAERQSAAPVREAQAGSSSPAAQTTTLDATSAPTESFSKLQKETAKAEVDGEQADAARGAALSANSTADRAAPATAAPSAAAAATPPGVALGTSALPRAGARAAAAASFEIVSPDPRIRWRIAGGALEHSEDGGGRWDAVAVGTDGSLTAGAAPSVSVCWVVGRGGVVLLAADGRTWRRLAFPETADLVSVRATDARAASVSTANGRTFGTIDGGATWSRE